MIKLYNTLHRAKEEFKPINPRMVKIYSCWPTVYSEPHIGNIRYFWFCSLLRNTLQYIWWYDITHVMNITDVGHLTDDGDSGEDKMEKWARREGKTARDVAELYSNKFIAILNQLDIHFEYNPKATDYIQEQIDMIIALEKSGHTYIIANDGVYFDTSTVADYGILVGQKHLNWLQSGARIENDYKRNITDFALWKFNITGKKRDMERESPRGIGFPWRHIECSAMSKKLLGNHFDIHTWGIDHIPVHHTNEIAQSECGGCDTPRVNYRMHTQFLNVDGQKISKSLGNDIYIRDILTKWYTIEDLRMFFLAAHYRSFQDFTWEGMEMARKRRENLKKKLHQFKDYISENSEKDLKYNDLDDKLTDWIRDDLNTLVWLSDIDIYISNQSQHIAYNKNKKELWILWWDIFKNDFVFLDTVQYMDKYIYKLWLFDFSDIDNEDNLTEISEEISSIASSRRQAKLDKNRALADDLRNKLMELWRNMKDGKDNYEIEKL